MLAFEGRSRFGQAGLSGEGLPGRRAAWTKAPRPERAMRGWVGTHGWLGCGILVGAAAGWDPRVGTHECCQCFREPIYLGGSGAVGSHGKETEQVLGRLFSHRTA